MSNKEPELIQYHWYAISASGATGTTVAQLIAHKDRIAVVRYKSYTSFFFRTTHQIQLRNIYGKVKDPRWLPRLAMCFASLFLELKFDA